jgi:hypothetical protein
MRKLRNVGYAAGSFPLLRLHPEERARHGEQRRDALLRGAEHPGRGEEEEETATAANPTAKRFVGVTASPWCASSAAAGRMYITITTRR